MTISKQYSSVNTFEELLHHLRILFEADQVDIDTIKQLMFSYQSDPAEWIKYAHHDPTRYTRNLVDSGNGKYNLMILCWPSRIASTIHDHSEAHCVMKILSGSLYEVQYSWPETVQKGSQFGGMEKIAETRLDKANSVAYINDTIGLHRVENRDQVCPAVSLHLYCPPFSKCQVFDEKTGINRSVDVTFDTKHELKPIHYKVSRKSISTGIAPSKDVLIFRESAKMRT